jgi:hypothetical protein
MIAGPETPINLGWARLMWCDILCLQSQSPPQLGRTSLPRPPVAERRISFFAPARRLWQRSWGVGLINMINPRKRERTRTTVRPCILVNPRSFSFDGVCGGDEGHCTRSFSFDGVCGGDEVHCTCIGTERRFIQNPFDSRQSPPPLWTARRWVTKQGSHSEKPSERVVI